jgi:hypothetical protein
MMTSERVSTTRTVSSYRTKVGKTWKPAVEENTHGDLHMETYTWRPTHGDLHIETYTSRENT